METRHVSDRPRFRMKDGIFRLGAADAGVSPRDFASVVTRLLDEFDAADFRSAERILDVIRRQGRTVSGHPRVRPADCDRVIEALQTVFEAYRPALITGDDTIVERFEQILEAFAKTDVRHYPRELTRVRALQAEARLLLHDPAGARSLIGAYADRIYKIEGDRKEMIELMRLDCQARAALGAVEDLGRISIGRAVALARLFPHAVRKIASELIEFLGFDHSARARDGVLTWLLVRSARTTARARTPGGTIPRRAAKFAFSQLGILMAASCLSLLRRGDVRFAGRTRAEGEVDHSRDIVVTRAMGGIGDLLIMTAGLRALSKRHGTPVKFVIERKYFDLFRNNPHVELVDIDGPPVDVIGCKAWYNLTLCPAGRYEASRRPYVKKGRVELFAKGMGVGKASLYAHGWGVEYFLDSAQVQFRDDFIREAGLGGRPIIGMQPYSRNSYKDHPDIGRFIEALSADYDVIIFHHVETSLPAGPGIVSTAGLSLSQSIALVSALQAMVRVDFGLPARGGGFRRAGDRDVRSDRRKIVHPTSSSGDGDLGQGELRLRALLAKRGPALPADGQVRAKSVRRHVEG